MPPVPPMLVNGYTFALNINSQKCKKENDENGDVTEFVAEITCPKGNSKTERSLFRHCWIWLPRFVILKDIAKYATLSTKYCVGG